jgi:hypothetical protein
MTVIFVRLYHLYSTGESGASDTTGTETSRRMQESSVAPIRTASPILRRSHEGKFHTMTARKLTHWFAAACAMMAPSVALGQVDDFCEPSCYHEDQWFSPVDFDFDCQPIERDCGVFFNYNRVSWFITGERTSVGVPNLTDESEEIWPEDLALDPADGPPGPYVITNSLQDVTPGEFGWGHRYEFGYFNGPHGVMVGIIDDMRTFSSEVYGGGPQFSGFGSLHVNYELQTPDLLTGFRDYNGVVVDGVEVPTPTITGPGGFGDGVTDDLNGNLAAGPVALIAIIDDEEVIVGIAVDYGDGYRFNSTYNAIGIRNETRTDGVELMKTYVLDNNHWMKTEQNGQVEVGAGVRYLRIKDEFGFLGSSDLFRGGNFVDTKVENNIVGPQIYARYTKQVKRWQAGIGGRFMFGYNVQNLDQEGAIGRNMTPGDLNQPFLLQPRDWRYGEQANDFSPVAELRADLAFKVTSAISLKLGYTCIYTDNVTRASSVTKWSLPDMGFNAAGQQGILINGADGGVELVY